MKKAFIVFIIIGILLFFIVPRDSKAAWYDSSYAYRKSHALGGAAGAGTNYQIKITAYRTTGTDSAGTVYLGSGIQNDFDDVRFTASDQTTPLDFWVASSTDGVSAEFWVEVSDDLASNQTMYIYYQNASASSGSNGDNTFLFFDDFDDANINGTKWTQEITSGTITESSGYLRAGGGSTSAPYGHTSLGSSFTAYNNNALMYKARNATNAIGEVAFRGNYAGNTGYKYRFDARSGQGNAMLEPPYASWNYSNGSGTCTSDSSVPTVDTWYRYEITSSSTVHTFYRNGAQMRQCTDASYTSAGQISLQNHYGSYTDYDWVAVRKFVNPEPTHGVWGSEETPPTVTRTPVRIHGGGIRINGGGLIIE